MACILSVYYVLNGFGEKPVRALGSLLMMILGVSCLLYMHGGQETSPTWTSLLSLSGLGEALFKGAEFIFYLKKIDLNPTTAWWGIALVLLGKIMIPLQAALLGLALRNTVRR